MCYLNSVLNFGAEHLEYFDKMITPPSPFVLASHHPENNVNELVTPTDQMVVHMVWQDVYTNKPLDE